ncbi:class I SAM-dependent DNA methyltransferase [Gudongella sp. DL1XJH-153]|uniref:class I SAM-dependent DNA methyltransferase n=1 Tax=Gudongella sp. DL1XJH-153 TaxID=3409804 RepID=UPI003BB78462
MASYGSFASLYDVLMDDFDYVAWSGYIQRILSKNGIDHGIILEMACGTGSLTKELLDLGYRVDGFDLSEEMLAVAQNKLSKNKKLRLFNMDMTEFKMDRKYQAIVAACDSINYILSESSLKETFRRAYDHLDDGGLLIFDINSEYKLREILGNNIFLEDRDEVFYTWENQFDEDTDICNFYLTFFHSNDGENYKRFDEVHREKVYSIETIINLLRDVGFVEIEKYEAFVFEDVKKESERINFVAKKK